MHRTFTLISDDSDTREHIFCIVIKYIHRDKKASLRSMSSTLTKYTTRNCGGETGNLPDGRNVIVLNAVAWLTCIGRHHAACKIFKFRICLCQTMLVELYKGMSCYAGPWQAGFPTSRINFQNDFHRQGNLNMRETIRWFAKLRAGQHVTRCSKSYTYPSCAHTVQGWLNSVRAHFIHSSDIGTSHTA